MEKHTCEKLRILLLVVPDEGTSQRYQRIGLVEVDAQDELDTMDRSTWRQMDIQLV